jgi:hypothetical protein
VVKPNIFSYATSELSQDAFICWLLTWAQKDYRDTDPLLHRCANDLLAELFKGKGHVLPTTIVSFDILKQLHDADIFVIINNKFGIIIEDKTFTSQHSDQLPKYLELIGNDPVYKDLTLIPIYFKTGNQSNFTEVLGAGYDLFNRKDFLTILEAAIQAGAKNDILLDYYYNLKNIDQEFDAFQTKSLDRWNSRAWQGFFAEIQEQMKTGHWGYVANQTGGFQGFWWNFHNTNEYQLHIQLEEGKLCFKINILNEGTQSPSAQRNEWSKKIIESGKAHHLEVKKPDRFGRGKYMTVAVLNHDYRHMDENQLINTVETIQFLKKAENVLNDAIVKDSLNYTT